MRRRGVGLAARNRNSGSLRNNTAHGVGGTGYDVPAVELFAAALKALAVLQRKFS